MIPPNSENIHSLQFIKPFDWLPSIMHSKASINRQPREDLNLNQYRQLPNPSLLAIVRTRNAMQQLEQACNSSEQMSKSCKQREKNAN